MIGFHEQRAVKLVEEQLDPKPKEPTRKELVKARLAVIKARRSLDSNIITEANTQSTVKSEEPTGFYMVRLARAAMSTEKKPQKKSIIQRKKERNSMENFVYRSLTGSSPKNSRVGASSGETVAFDLATHEFGPLAKDAIAGMGLTMRHLRKMKRAFDAHDEDKGGTIDHLEFLHALGQSDQQGELNNPFTEMVFNGLIMDFKVGMTFDEFVRMAATVCMFTHGDMLKYVWECFSSSDGRFEHRHFLSLTEAVNAVALRGGPRRWSDVLDKYDNNFNGFLTEDQFVTMTKDYHQILYFAYQLQNQMQEKSGLSDKYYLKMLERQHRALKIEDYKRSHEGKLPEEPFSLAKWMQKVSVLGYDNYDERTEDNTMLVLLGKPMFDRCSLLKAQLLNAPVVIDIPKRNSAEGETKKNRSKRPTYSLENPLVKTPSNPLIKSPSQTGKTLDIIDITTSTPNSPTPNGIESGSNTPVETDSPSQNTVEGETKDWIRKPRSTLQGAIDVVLKTPLIFSPESPLLKSILGSTLDISNDNSPDGEQKQLQSRPSSPERIQIQSRPSSPGNLLSRPLSPGNPLDINHISTPNGNSQKNGTKPTNFSPDTPLVSPNRSSFDGELKKIGSKRSSPENPLVRSPSSKSRMNTDPLAIYRSSFDGAPKRRPRTSTLQGAIDSAKNKRSSFSPEKKSTLSPG